MVFSINFAFSYSKQIYDFIKDTQPLKQVYIWSGGIPNKCISLIANLSLKLRVILDDLSCSVSIVWLTPFI